MALLSVITLLIKNPTVGYSVYLKLLIITYINYCFFTPWVQAGALRLCPCELCSTSEAQLSEFTLQCWTPCMDLGLTKHYSGLRSCEWPLKCRTCAHMSCQPAASSSSSQLSQDKMQEAGLWTYTAPASKCENTSKNTINRTSLCSQKVRKGSPGIKKKEEVE